MNNLSQAEVKGTRLFGSQNEFHRIFVLYFQINFALIINICVSLFSLVNSGVLGRGLKLVGANCGYTAICIVLVQKRSCVELCPLSLAGNAKK